MTTFVDSDRRCPRADCGKRLVIETGQATDAGDLAVVHACLQCGYTESQGAWSKPLKTDGAAAQRLLKQRLHGVELQLVYDATPFPGFDLDDLELTPEQDDDAGYCLTNADRLHCTHWYTAGAMCCDCYQPGIPVVELVIVRAGS